MMKVLDFLNKVRSSGIKIPIIPGILPVTNCEKVIEFSKKSGTSVPGWMKKIFQGLDLSSDNNMKFLVTKNEFNITWLWFS